MTMNNDTLILYYYGDGLSDEARSEVEAALENDATVRERYRALWESLEAFSEPPAAPVPAHLAAQWHHTIAQAAAAERAGHAVGAAWHFPSFAWGALAAALVAGVGIGLYVAVRPPPVPIADGAAIDSRPAAPATAQTSFTRGLETHLRRTRQNIARLGPDDDENRAMLIMDIVRQNRLFERTAHEHDAEDLARVLRALEPVLLRLAGRDLSAQDTTSLTAKLEFELAVMLTKMQRRDSYGTGSI